MGKSKKISTIILIVSAIALVVLASIVVYMFLKLDKKDRNKVQAKAENSVYFNVEKDVYCNVEAYTAINDTMDVEFNSVHENSKNIKFSSLSNSAGLKKTSGNTSLDKNVWSPWTEKDNTTLTNSDNVIYWIIKITNTSDSPIQVRITAYDGSPLRTIGKGIKLYKNYGSDGGNVPMDTFSGEISKNETCYLRIALENNSDNMDILNEWNFRINIEKAGMSYFSKDWQSIVGAGVFENLESITFLGGDGKGYTGLGEDKYSFGCTDLSGEYSIVEETDTIKDIRGYLNGKNLYIHSPAIIYAPLNCEDMFSNLKNLTILNLNNFDTSNTMNMSGMFGGLSLLTRLDLQSFDTSNVEDMRSMFAVSHVENLDLSSFDTSKVTDMSDMFMMASCKTINLSSFDTSNVTNMPEMFVACRNITTLDLSSFNTSKVENMSYMFANCEKLTVLDLSNFDTSNVKNMEGMFAINIGTTLHIKSLKINGKFAIKNGTNVNNFFYFETGDVVEEIYLPEIIGDSITIRLNVPIYDKETGERVYLSGTNEDGFDASHAGKIITTVASNVTN